jgi:uncharacterized NAD(P)/FAD-binding protein YdhS
VSSPRFVVVGGGASGTLLAAQILRQAKGPVEVVLAEPGRIGRGMAYGTPHHEHLLNVPSGRMSALPEDPDHFVRWLQGAGQPADPGGFAPRRAYGAYLESLVVNAAASAAGGVRFHRIRDDAVAIGRHASGALVVMRSGRALEAARVAIAVGNLAGHGPLPPLHCHARYVGDPWAVGALDGIPPADPVLVLGTGLTMVDIALTLSARSHAAPIHAVSRHGLLPRSHAPGAAAPPIPRLPAPAPSLREWVRWMRGLGEAGPRECWRPAIDALRPVTQEAWARLGEPDRRRFLRHLRPYWDVHRHRTPPSVADSVAGLLQTGRLEVQAARVAEVRAHTAGFEVQLAPRGGRRPHTTLRPGWIVNATGPEADVGRARSPLLRQMLSDGLARPDDLRLGLDATPAGALLDDGGRPSSFLFALGPLLRGKLWETTAVPEIRRQAQALATGWLDGLA